MRPPVIEPGELDDGLPGVGLRGMEERVRQLNGKFRIASGPEGTTIAAFLPIPAESAVPVDTATAS